MKKNTPPELSAIATQLLLYPPPVVTKRALHVTNFIVEAYSVRQKFQAPFSVLEARPREDKHGPWWRRQQRCCLTTLLISGGLFNCSLIGRLRRGIASFLLRGAGRALKLLVRSRAVSYQHRLSPYMSLWALSYTIPHEHCTRNITDRFSPPVTIV